MLMVCVEVDLCMLFLVMEILMLVRSHRVRKVNLFTKSMLGVLNLVIVKSICRQDDNKLFFSLTLQDYQQAIFSYCSLLVLVSRFNTSSDFIYTFLAF